LPVARQVNRPKQVFTTQLRHDAQCFGWRDDLHVHTDALGPANTALELTQLLFARGQAQATDVVEQSQLAVHFDAVFAELHQGLRGSELSYQASCITGFATGDLAFFQNNHICPPQFCQMVGDAYPINATANDDDSGLIFHAWIASSMK